MKPKNMLKLSILFLCGLLAGCDLFMSEPKVKISPVVRDMANACLNFSQDEQKELMICMDEITKEEEEEIERRVAEKDLKDPGKECYYIEDGKLSVSPCYSGPKELSPLGAKKLELFKSRRDYAKKMTPREFMDAMTNLSSKELDEVYFLVGEEKDTQD